MIKPTFSAISEQDDCLAAFASVNAPGRIVVTLNGESFALDHATGCHFAAALSELLNQLSAEFVSDFAVCPRGENSEAA